MNQQIRNYFALFVLAIVMAACALPPEAGGMQPSSSDQVAAQVTSTLQILTPVASEVTSALPSELLPYTFYYLGLDGGGSMQVFRIERDGVTQHQLTFEPVNVLDYDVSLVDGNVAYVAKNQLLLVNADGSGRNMLVDGGPIDGPYFRPVFSPDGQMLAYALKGLNLYTVSTGVSNLVIEDQLEDAGNGLVLPHETYWPEKYSPDGTKLLITLGYLEGGSMAIYDPGANALVRLMGDEDALICYTVCNGSEIEWSADSSGFYSANSQNDYSSRTGGLWKVDAVNGAVKTLIPFSPGDGTINFPDEPYLAPDGQLYYFFLNYAEPSGPPQRPPQQLVRSAPDGVTGRTVLRADTFELMNEALWAPDASFVIVAYGPTQDVYDGGQAEIVYLDSRPNVVLASFAQQMKWGHRKP